jgi:hypothetical protein
LLCDRALTAIYHFQRVWIIRSLSAISLVLFFVKKKKRNLMVVSKTLDTLGGSSRIVFYSPQKINVGPTGI